MESKRFRNIIHCLAGVAVAAFLAAPAVAADDSACLECHGSRQQVADAASAMDVKLTPERIGAAGGAAGRKPGRCTPVSPAPTATRRRARSPTRPGCCRTTRAPPVTTTPSSSSTAAPTATRRVGATCGRSAGPATAPTTCGPSRTRSRPWRRSTSSPAVSRATTSGPTWSASTARPCSSRDSTWPRPACRATAPTTSSRPRRPGRGWPGATSRSPAASATAGWPRRTERACTAPP